jgi:predicted phosphoribosyltransferase
MPFKNRRDAGRQLAQRLRRYAKIDPVVLALPRGGVPVAAEVAAALGAQLDLILVRKVGVPGQSELAMGAVADGSKPLVVRNEDVVRAAGVDEAAFQAACARELAELERRRARYMGGGASVDLTERVAIIVDDGVATGATTRAAIRAVGSRGARQIVLAVPVAPTEMLLELKAEVDEIVCLESYEDFGAVGMYYADFRATSDEAVAEAMARYGANPKSSRSGIDEPLGPGR